jgi:uncharacterized protein (TIGR02284 family)
MSNDASVTKDLLQTLEDGRAGYEKGAEKLDSTDSPQLATTFRQYSEQRAGFAVELRTLAQQYGDDIDANGSLAGTLHRGWLTLKDALSGSSPEGVLDAAEQGEDHAVTEFEKALDDDVSPELRTVVQRQLTEIRAARDDVKALRNQLSS